MHARVITCPLQAGTGHPGRLGLLGEPSALLWFAALLVWVPAHISRLKVRGALLLVHYSQRCLSLHSRFPGNFVTTKKCAYSGATPLRERGALLQEPCGHTHSVLVSNVTIIIIDYMNVTAHTALDRPCVHLQGSELCTTVPPQRS